MQHKPFYTLLIALGLLLAAAPSSIYAAQRVGQKDTSDLDDDDDFFNDDFNTEASDALNEKDSPEAEEAEDSKKKELAQRLEALKFNSSIVQKTHDLDRESLFYLEKMIANLEALPQLLTKEEDMKREAWVRDQVKKMFQKTRWVANADELLAATTGAAAGIASSSKLLGLITYLFASGALRYKASLPIRAAMRLNSGEDPVSYTPKLPPTKQDETPNKYHGVIERMARATWRGTKRAAGFFWEHGQATKRTLALVAIIIALIASNKQD